MYQPDLFEERLKAAQQEIRQLRSELRASELHLARTLEMLEAQQGQLDSHQASIVRVDRVLMDLTTGRLWRTLRAAGNLVKKFLPANAENGASPNFGRKNTILVCDEPLVTETRPRSGLITVRGWCLAEGGVDAVEVEIPGLPPLRTKPNVPRPDVKKAHPVLDTDGQAGFTMEFDSLALSKGRYPLTLRVISQGVTVREAKTFVEIDHEKGFASDYQRWIHEFERPDNDLIELKLPSFSRHPLISILTPVYNTDPAELTAALQSVLDQSYQNWELCLADDASSLPEVRQILEEFAAKDDRIKVVYRPQRGGISRACNAAWEIATGDYLCFLDHDDTLAPHALAYVCEALNQDPAADLIYSDEDKIDAKGRRSTPFFKPDWSPDLLLSENYVSHLLVLRSDLAKAVGFLNPEFDGSQDYDLILRASARAAQIRHIPKVLYHWRAGVLSTATSLDNKSYALEAARKALEGHCLTAGEGSAVEPGSIAGRWRVRHNVPAGSQVSIIIASGGRVETLRTNLESLYEKTTYTDYDVVIIDNSKNTAIERLVHLFQATRSNLRYIDWRNKPFNYSAINNAAAKECHSPVLLFLNDDTSVIAPGWLEAMLEHALRPDIGAVGAKLLYPNGAIQHAGVVMGLFDNCGHAFKGLPGETPHYFDFSDVIRNVSAVTGACLMTRADTFWQAGGFDEAQFAVAFNDIDLCLKIASFGYRNLYTPHALLYHHESLSKTSKDLIPHPEEVAGMRFKWDKVIAGDPYYSPNLTRNDEDYSLRARA
ncbi:MAG TPA: glycosyltransferase family 2 protein [Bryobacteraceae bacterium]|nr:glycosyltransferase family 2 protein [Bryobacteraceae bacterium]